MNSVTLIGTVAKPVANGAFVLAVERAGGEHDLVPVVVKRAAVPPACGDRVAVEGSLHSGSGSLTLEADSIQVLRHMPII